MAQFRDVTFTGRIKHYPRGLRELMACSVPVFRAAGWEERNPPSRDRKHRKRPGDSDGDLSRSIRRARQKVRDIGLCNDFVYFVTLTLDATRVDRHDMKEVTRRLNAWLSNQVQRRGLKYVLVPELHKDGAIHFHGFFNGALEAVDSGTVIPPEGGKPRRPRSKAQRADWIKNGGRVVYNLPAWTLGFTTAIELYGDYEGAVGYVCKYIGKAMGGGGEGSETSPAYKIGGRWYYSGGDLTGPHIEYVDLEWRELAEMPGAHLIEVPEAGAVFVKVVEKTVEKVD